MGWVYLYMFVILKIPVVAAIWLVWWAAKEPEQATDHEDGGGSDRDHPRDPLHPRPPRRGPHAEPPPRPPERVRVRAAPPDRVHAG